MFNKYHFLCLALVLLSGCKQQRMQLPPLTPETAHYQESKDGITLRVKQYNESEKRALFGGYVKPLRDIVAMQVAISNQSDRKSVV